MRLVPDDPATGVVTQQGGGYTTPSTAALFLELVAADDFNSDGKADILFQDTGTGALTLWVMDGLTQRSTVSLGTEGAGWKVAGSGNFNEDQAIDIVWRHTDGRVRVWLMNPDTLTTHVTRNLNPNQEPDTSWVIVGPH
jgi:hypothetical protein